MPVSTWRLRLAFIGLGLLCLSASSSHAQKWREVQSPHFRIVTDGTVQQGRDVAREFEQMRSVFATRFHNPTLETGAPLLIIAVDEDGLHSLAPSFWKQRDNIAGEFFRHWERQFALVRLDNFGDLNQAVVFHEYTHTILHANLHWLPTWLDEGLAEFYGYTRFQGDRTYIGAPSIRIAHLRNDTLLPLSEVLIDNDETYAKDQRREDLFYGESWAMVHYMTFGPDMEHGAKLNQFIDLLESGKNQLQAFQQIFGDPNKFQKKLSNYISLFAFQAGVMPPVQGLDEKSFEVRVLSPAEVDYDIASIDIGAHDFKSGRDLLEKAETADPSLAGPHEELGFLDWTQGLDQQAASEWQKAVAADPAASYRSAFALLMSATPLKDQTPQQLIATELTLDALHRQAIRFAPILVELALVKWRQGQLNQAYQFALAAEKLEPWRAEYHLLTAHILLQGNQPAVAANYARTVADRWPTTDHDEAVDLWNRIPPNMRGDGPPLKSALPANATIVRGEIVTTSCDASGVHLTLQPASPNTTPLKLDSHGPFENGFADTLWFGEDHYTPCHHLAGLPAVAAYKPGTNQLLVLEVRDNLPDTNTATPPSSQP